MNISKQLTPAVQARTHVTPASASRFVYVQPQQATVQQQRLIIVSQCRTTVSQRLTTVPQCLTLPNSSPPLLLSLNRPKVRRPPGSCRGRRRSHTRLRGLPAGMVWVHAQKVPACRNGVRYTKGNSCGEGGAYQGSAGPSVLPYRVGDAMRSPHS
jgi:hypothetical protein